MGILGLIAAVLSAAYALIALVLFAGTLRGWRKGREIEIPSVSVVVAARNEERDLPACLESLRAQEYPKKRFTVTVVDDRSTDRTGEIVAALAEDWPALTVIRVDECSPAFGGKQNALATGIEASDEELILMTDADCTVPSNWVRDVARTFGAETGLVAGLATMPAGLPFWKTLQAADLAHLFGAAWGFVGLGAPFSAMGNNLAVRRKAYDEVGGYRGLGHSIAEDCALVAALARSTAPPSTAVTTQPSDSVREFLYQRVRWSDGVKHVGALRLAFLLTVGLQRVVTLAAVVLALPGLVHWGTAVIAGACWVGADMLMVDRVAVAIHRPGLLVWSPLVTLWQAIYQPVVAVWSIALKGRTVWKGENYG